jgi:pyruvate kinase
MSAPAHPNTAVPSDPGSLPWDPATVAALIGDLTALRAELVSMEARLRTRLETVHPEHRAGATNLVHYVALRRRDLRDIQDRLAWIGLSSLGRAESHVLANLDKVMGLLHRLAGKPWSARSTEEPAGFRSGASLLERHTEALLGPPPPTRDARIMVTLPAEAALDYALVRTLLAAGMDCARINCAHDDAAVWSGMLSHLERARRELSRDCTVLMDLGGPKLRTGELEPRPEVLKWRPSRDAFGRVIAPARIFLSPTPGAPAPADAHASLAVDARWLNALRAGETVEFTDTRGARRLLRIGEAQAGGRWAEASQTAYVGRETVFRRMQPTLPEAARDTLPLAVPARNRPLLLRAGDTLVLTHDDCPGAAATVDACGQIVRPAHMPCTLPQVFRHLHPGERVWLDDGRIGAVIRHVSHGEVHLEITVARPEGEKLDADKGINLPDSELDLPALTDKDLQDLEFVAKRADMVGLSFVQRAADVERLQTELARLGRPELGIVLKIETARAFRHLPDLLLAAMRSPRTGVMIARGDLAVELGYERLAEVQEEILWLAEAAHLPVIWATQVLETLAKRGQPSRAEITDAAMGERAECVMLNKGPHVDEAIRTLDDILSRMGAHQHKKRAMLRRLHWWEDDPA